MSTLSLHHYGALKSRAERDAKAILQLLLKKRAAGADLSMKDVTAYQTKSALAYLEAEGLFDETRAIAATKFYVKECDRQIETLMEVLMAAHPITTKEPTP